METSVREDIKEQYDDCYKDGASEWRKIGAFKKFEHILKLTNDIEFTKVLEVGAGDGSILDLMDKNNFAPEIYALEISESGIEAIKKRNLKSLAKAEKFDGYKIPYPDNYFDLVVLSHVLEHVEYERTILREIKRVSKYQIIEVPREYHHNIDKQINHYLSYGHLNIYTPSSLRFLLKSENFEVIKDLKDFYSNKTVRFNKKGFKWFKANIFLVLRNTIFFFLPTWRKDTMINTYTILCR